MPMDRYFVTFLTDNPIKVWYDVIASDDRFWDQKNNRENVEKNVLPNQAVYTLMPQY